MNLYTVCHIDNKSQYVRLNSVENYLQHLTKMASISTLVARLGLDDKELAVFMALLTHGAQPVSMVAKYSGITRTHVYDIAESLLKRGLVTSTGVKGARRYEAIEYSGLLALVAAKQKELVKLEKDLSEAASDFNALKSSTKPKTQVRFFEGSAGIRQILNELRSDLKKAGEVELITIFPVDRLSGGVTDFIDNMLYINLPNVTKRDIIEDGPLAREYIKQISQGPVKHLYKIWPKEWGELVTDTVCWGDKVEISDVADPTNVSGILITNAAYAATYRMWFNQMWNSLPDKQKQ